MIAMQKVHSFAIALDYNDSKLNLKDESQRAEVLDHNFLEYNKEEILREVKMMNQCNTNLVNDGYHVALSFSEKDNHLTNVDLIAIADGYKKGMGFSDEHLFILYKHNDGEDHQHIHVHLLLHRLSIDEYGKARVVSDSNNFQRSEAVCRSIEKKYNLDTVKSSHTALDRAPTKDELEMIQRNGRASERMLMQQRVKLALASSIDIYSFIENCKLNGIYLLFNQSGTTGLVSGITYISQNGFIAKGQKLGNQFKWNNLSQNLKYGKQSRDGETIRQTNIDTRSRFEDSLNTRNRQIECENFKNGSTARDCHRKSVYFISTDQETNGKGNNSGYTADSETNSRNQETEPSIEETISDQLSSRSGAIISSFSGLFGSIIPEEVDENSRRKNKGYGR